jgi:hypothetical protein
MAGRSRADKEADQDARLKALLVVGCAVALVILVLHAIFSVAGLQLGWWSAPVFVPVFVWVLFSAAMNRVLRPVELDGWRWPARLKGAGLLGCCCGRAGAGGLARSRGRGRRRTVAFTASRLMARGIRCTRSSLPLR